MKRAADESLSSMSRAIRKPLMEKRRRARMNESMETLKDILLQSGKHTAPVQSKMDKADILELTVQYLQQLLGQETKMETVSPQIPHKPDATEPWRPW